MVVTLCIVGQSHDKDDDDDNNNKRCSRRRSSKQNIEINKVYKIVSEWMNEREATDAVKMWQHIIGLFHKLSLCTCCQAEHLFGLFGVITDAVVCVFFF